MKAKTYDKFAYRADVEADTLRRQIKGNKLIQKLQEHVLDDKPMRMSQIQAADKLLKKVLPDARSAEEQAPPPPETKITIKLDG